jgi:Carboxylesterase family
MSRKLVIIRMLGSQLLVAAAVLAAGSVSAAITQPVKVEGGLVSGIPGTDSSIAVFKGIPFAAPPVGDLRWRAPKPVVAWQGLRAADKFSASCIQNVVQERKPWTYEFMTHGAMQRRLPVPERLDSGEIGGRKTARLPLLVWRWFLRGFGGGACL